MTRHLAHPAAPLVVGAVIAGVVIAVGLLLAAVT